jgi:hypothetical protein
MGDEIADDLKEKRERATHFLELLLGQYDTYHNHKELMAHAGLLLQVGLAAVVFSAEQWPPCWLDTFLHSQVAAAVGIAIIWLFIHFFIRWQLRNRRGAAVLVAAIQKTLLSWVHSPPKKEDLEPYNAEEEHNRWFATVVDFLFPRPSARLHQDVEKQGYPIALVREWKQQAQEGTGAVHSEWFLFFSSVIMLAVALLRTGIGN